MTNDSAARFFPARADVLSPEDFETASIRSAAPSYVSDAPSYHSTVPTSEAIPPYSPPANRSGSAAAVAAGPASTPAAEPARSSTPRPSPAQQQRAGGLPPIPPLSRAVPTLSEFRIPTWSTISANPTARHYHSVARRRVARDADPSEALRHLIVRQLIDQEEERETRQFRPLEDPYLVGEEAARKARAERLARENGDDILIRENHRWDWYFAQTRENEERERSWPRFRRDIEGGSRRMKLAGRLGGRLLF